MKNDYKPYPYPSGMNTQMNNPYYMYNGYQGYQHPYYGNTPMYNQDFWRLYNPYIPSMDGIDYAARLESLKDDDIIELKDYGPEPFVVNIEEATRENTTFRTALWTGSYLQLTLMSIRVGEDIGLEIHPNLDQFIRIEEGQGLVKMGDKKDHLDFQKPVYDDFAFIIPAGKWHNLINTGSKPLKLYSIYAPPQHPHGTVHETKAVAEAAEENHSH